MLYWVCFLICGSLAVAQGRGKGFGPGEQHWEYVEVREGAHMFYWLYYTTANVSHYTERPLVLWLQGGPGGPSTALGNFYEIGPVDIHGNPREGNWVQHVNVLFVDSPVGAGFSYVDNLTLLVTNNNELTNDLVTFMQYFYKSHKEFKKVPLHIFSESYGGRVVPEFATKLELALSNGEMAEPNLLKSISIGNPWISTRHICKEHSRYLFVNGLIDEDGMALIDSQEEKILSALKAHEFSEATDQFLEWMNLMQNLTGEIFLYNTQTHLDPDEDRTYGYAEELTEFMKNNISEVLKINGSVYAEQVLDQLEALHGDRLKAEFNTIPRLLNGSSIKVNLFSGQLDCLVPTSATLAVIKDWSWRNKREYLQAYRQPIIVNRILQGYEKVGGNFGMYWINRSGHMALADNPTAMAYILKAVTHYDGTKTD